MFAVINPEACVGCTKCLKVCPVSAISGARKTAHVVEADTCTACGDCFPACPVENCITWNDGTPPPPRPAKKPRRTTLTGELPPELAARVAAARTESRRRYENKGPLNTPKLLRGR